MDSAWVYRFMDRTSADGYGTIWLTGTGTKHFRLAVARSPA
jgi:hypothetical protein